MPVAVTGTASSIAPTSARLNGSVTPNGRSTIWWFEYGTSTSYGSKTSQHNAGSGTARIDVSATLTQLAVATTYHYRLVAKNDAGTSLGGDRTFSTSLPPGVTTGIPRDVAHASATATGAVDPRGRKTTWYFEYGTSTAYGARTSSKSAGSGKAVPVTAPLSKLSPATTYHYRLVATSDAGTSRGSDVSFTTTGVTLAAPALQVFYGRSVALFGAVPTKLAGERVTIFAQRFGEGSFQSVATVLTGASGTWTLLVSPRIQTAYRASWNDGLSAATTIGVHPGISLRVTAARRLATHVAGTHSFAGRFVKLQRRSASGRWVTVARARLGLRSSAVFRVDLPTGASTLRVAMSVNQAGAGYLGGVSRTLVYHRR
jgi:hypothetical protein